VSGEQASRLPSIATTAFFEDAKLAAVKSSDNRQLPENTLRRLSPFPSLHLDYFLMRGGKSQHKYLPCRPLACRSSPRAALSCYRFGYRPWRTLSSTYLLLHKRINPEIQNTGSRLMSLLSTARAYLRQVDFPRIGYLPY